MSDFVVREFTPDDAEEVARWRYGGEWAVYDLPGGAPPLRAEDGYFAVADRASGGVLAGFGCTGAEARIPGLPAEAGTIDMGVGMAPALVGRGHGRAFGAAVLAHVQRTAGGATALRAVVQRWNERSLRLARVLGFAETGTHVCVQGGRPVRYAVLGRPLGGPVSVVGGRGFS